MITRCSVNCFILLCIVSSLFVGGCTMMTPLERDHFKEDIAPKQITDSQTITFQKVVYKEDDIVIGHHHDGYARVRHRQYHLSDTVPTSEYIAKVINDELRKYGYQAIGGKDELFQRDEEEVTVFIIGAIIYNIQYNTYAPLAGNFNETYIDVEWQLFDTKINDIVFKQRLDAYVRIEKTPVESETDDSTTSNYDKTTEYVEVEMKVDPMAECFKKAFHAVMNNNDFVQIVK